MTRAAMTGMELEIVATCVGWFRGQVAGAFH